MDDEQEDKAHVAAMAAHDWDRLQLFRLDADFQQSHAALRTTAEMLASLRQVLLLEKEGFDVPESFAEVRKVITRLLGAIASESEDWLITYDVTFKTLKSMNESKSEQKKSE